MGRPDELILLGFAPRARILAGRAVAAGERLDSGYVPVEPIHRITVGELDDPLAWVHVHGGATPDVTPTRHSPAVEAALEACADLRRRDPELVRWIEDGHPTLTDAEHVARFGKPYRR